MIVYTQQDNFFMKNENKCARIVIMQLDKAELILEGNHSIAAIAKAYIINYRFCAKFYDDCVSAYRYNTPLVVSVKPAPSVRRRDFVNAVKLAIEYTATLHDTKYKIRNICAKDIVKVTIIINHMKN